MSPSSSSNSGNGIYVVTGATGGLGRRVVERLLARGEHVRAVARDAEKAKGMLESLPVAAGGKLEIVLADLAQPKTIPASLFAPDESSGNGNKKRVVAVLSCAAVKVQPKEGDTPDRSKYLQGIKFYDPEVADDSPRAVELGGMESLLFGGANNGANGAARALGASEVGWPLFDADNSNLEAASPVGELGALDDVVMGGVSRSSFSVVAGAGEDMRHDGEAPSSSSSSSRGAAGVFRGTLTDANNGGFASVRSRNCDPPLDLSASTCLAMRVRGDGRRYKLILRTDPGWDSLTYCASFDTKKSKDGDGQFETIAIPWSRFKPVFRARTAAGAPPLDNSRIVSLQLMLSKFEYDGNLNPTHTPGGFDFELRVARIVALAPGARRSPAFVHVSSAGVTRPNRPGINVDEEPPAVKMNSMLGGLLDYKLAAEDALRASGVPFAIVRPVALTEEPCGMPGISLEQGDTVKGKVSREDVADLVVALLECPEAEGTTFEVRSSVPFSEPWQGKKNGENFEKNDWKSIVASSGIRRGVTGKTVDGVYGGKEVEKGWRDPRAEFAELERAAAEEEAVTA